MLVDDPIAQARVAVVPQILAARYARAVARAVAAIELNLVLRVVQIRAQTACAGRHVPAAVAQVRRAALAEGQEPARVPG